MEKIVKGATKIKLAPPKAKYVEVILSATRGGEAGVAEIFRTLHNRLRDSTWTIVFKSLLVVHLMIREGEADVTLRYLAESPRRLAISNFTEGNFLDAKLIQHGLPVQLQGTNIRRYSDYLLQRAKAFHDTKTDYVRYGSGRLKKLSVEKGLLRETESVQSQIKALIRCDLLSNDPDNEITLAAFRMLTMDLLVLYSVMNEGTINVLEHYFEMSKPDATRALQIYKTFSRQTELVVQYLSVARQYELSTRLEIPKLKHAPTSLTNSLEEYLNDPDFEINRRQYLAQQEAKKSSGRKATTTLSAFDKEIKADSTFPSSKPVTTAPPKPVAKGPAPDLIDFFESIEDNQQTMAQQAPQQPVFNGFQQPQHFQQTGFVPQQQPTFPQQQAQPIQEQYSSTNPFAQNQSQTFSQQPQQAPQASQAPQLPPLQPDFTGAGFGGYTAQPQSHPTVPVHFNSFQSSLSSIPQEAAASFPQQPATPMSTTQQQFPQQQASNPFRQSTLSNQISGQSFASMSPPPSATLNRQSTNPFAKSAQQQQQQSGQSNVSFQNNPTSPFTSPPPQQPQAQVQVQAQPLQAQRTGTNPFAQNLSPAPTASGGPLRPNPTGSTNPFRQSAFIDQSTGQGWQHSANGTLGAFSVNQVQTTPVFPRPGG